MGEAAAARAGTGRVDAGAARRGDEARPRPAAGRAWAFRLAPASRVPLRDQIAVQVVAAVRAGSYGRGERLPSVRALASRLDVHRNTVRAAYRKLAGRGVVEVRPGSGVFVAPCPPPGDRPPPRDPAPAGARAGGLRTAGEVSAPRGRGPSGDVGREGRGAAAGDGERGERNAPSAADRRTPGETAPDAGTAPSSPPRGLPFRRFLARERARGRTWGEVARLMDRWRGAVAARRVTVVADDDLRRLWIRELRDALADVDVAVTGVAAAEARSRPACLARTVVAATAGRLKELRPLLPPWSEGAVLRPGPSPRARRLVLRLPPGSVVALVSDSRALRREIRELAAALRGGEVAVRGLAPGDVDGRRGVLRVARFVLTDVVCRPALAPEVDRRRLLTLRHLAREPARELARCFGAPAVPRGSGGSGGRPPSRSREGGDP